MPLKYTCSSCDEETVIPLSDIDIYGNLHRHYDVECVYCGNRSLITLRLAKVEPINNGEYDYE